MDGCCDTPVVLGVADVDAAAELIPKRSEHGFVGEDVDHHNFDLEAEWERIVGEVESKRGDPCLRASPLAKRYGWGFVFDADGKVALVASDSSEYASHAVDRSLMQLKAMKTKR